MRRNNFKKARRVDVASFSRHLNEQWSKTTWKNASFHQLWPSDGRQPEKFELSMRLRGSPLGYQYFERCLSVIFPPHRSCPCDWLHCHVSSNTFKSQNWVTALQTHTGTGTSIPPRTQSLDSLQHGSSIEVFNCAIESGSIASTCEVWLYRWLEAWGSVKETKPQGNPEGSDLLYSTRFSSPTSIGPHDRGLSKDVIRHCMADTESRR